MSLSIKKKSSFKPKIGQRRPAAAAASTQSSARPSVESQSQTLIPSNVAELLSVPGRDQHDDVPHHTSVEEHTPQQTSQDSNPIPNTSVIGSTSPNHTYHTQTETNDGPSVRPDEIASTASARRKLPSELPSQTSQNHQGVASANSTSQAPSLAKRKQGQETDKTARKRARVDNSTSVLETAERGDNDTQGHAVEHSTGLEVSVNDVHMVGIDHVEPSGAGHRRDQGAPIGGTSSGPSTSEPLQDNPSSIYPDPELSGAAATGAAAAGRNHNFSSTGHIINTAAIYPDGSAPLGLVVSTAGMNPDGTDEQSAQVAVQIQQPTAPKPKKKRAPRPGKVSARADIGNSELSIDDNGDDNLDDIRASVTRCAAGAKRIRKKRDPTKPRKQRGATPEGAEDEEFDTAQNTVAEMCKNLKVGKTSSRHNDIKQKQIELRAQAKLRRQTNERLWQSTLTDDEEVAEEQRNSVTAGESRDAAQTGGVGNADECEGRTPEAAELVTPVVEAPIAAHIPGPRMILRDGELVLAQDSLQIDRNALADVARGEEIETVKEDDFSRVFTSGTHMKREKGKGWSETEEMKFWESLRVFGTDFGMMAKLFGRSRTRRECKLKYMQLQKLYPDRMNRVSRGIPEPPNNNQDVAPTDEPTNSQITLEVKYKRQIEAKIGERLQETEAVMAELKALEEMQKREVEEAAQAAEAERNRKRDEILSRSTARKKRANEILRSVDDDGDRDQENVGRQASRSGREASAAPKRTAAPRGKGKKNPHSSHGGGTDIVLDSIEN
ncbi:hypothetical protein B0O99DRAFT_606306 [Bisporella sp. PMI_857]|nr:hypothetical protein B0O99DRAFT_606306 [Bisporella sp. PMI_857]